MCIAIQHDIHDADQFRERAKRVFPLPAGLHVHLFLPARDLSRATCVYEAPSLDQVREFLETALGESSTQEYFPIAEEHAMGLPARQLA